MGYNEFLEQITRNANNKLENYKELCRVCLKNHSNGVEISENSFSSIERREAIRSNYITITKKYLPPSDDEYPKYVCPTCETSLNELARFAQQIEDNARNWEIFLTTRRNEEDYQDEIKIEFCEDKYDIDPQTNESFKQPPLKIEEVYTESLVDVPATAKRRKKTARKREPSRVTTDFERTCHHCDKPTFSSLTQLYSHQKLIHPGVKAFSCDHCGSGFSAKDALVRHVKERHANNNGKKHQCQFCAKLFYSEREVRGHEKCHLNERSYVCSLCGKRFNSKTELNAHLKTKAHNADYRPKAQYIKSKNSPHRNVYRCTLCVPPTIYSNAEERANHRNTVHRIHDCDVCKNTFLTVESLNSHKLLHTDKRRPHVCSLCNATFSQASHLSSHIKGRHTEHKSFKCSFCDRAFSQSCHVKTHVNLVHIKGERSKCNECHADFSSKKYLQRHMVDKHSTIPSLHDCKDCGKRNSTSQQLALHRKKFHSLAL